MPPIDRKPKAKPKPKVKPVACPVCGDLVTALPPLKLWVCGNCWEPEEASPASLTRCIYCNGELTGEEGVIAVKFACHECTECRQVWVAGDSERMSLDDPGLASKLDSRLPSLWELRREVERLKRTEAMRHWAYRWACDALDDPRNWEVYQT